jgi:signal transduction histidine kinase
MRQLLSRFVQRLQWRLTAICVVTAVLSVTLINVFLLVIASSQLLSEENILQEVRDSLKTTEAEVAPFFADDGTVDKIKLTRWLDKEAYDMLIPEATKGWYLLIGWRSEATILVATAPDGTVLTASPLDSGTLGIKEGQSLSSQLPPAQRALFNRALGGEQVIIEKLESRIVVALRIHRKGKLVALGFVQGSPLPTFRTLWQGVPNILASTVTGMGIGSALVGGLIGSLTARGITRRLERVSGVAQQWAAGKLSASIAEGPADEIGQLERSLNQMALRLEQVFTLQNQVATLQERERITHDLHDTLKQEVFASTMLLGTAQEQLERGQLESLQTSLAQLDALMEQLQTNLSVILKALPFSTDSRELPELLPLWLGEWSRRSGIVSTVLGTAPTLPLPPETLLQIRSILSEALSNASRHSGATSVTLELGQSEGHITLRLHDDGRGFLATQRPSGMGMATMRERAGALPGGSLSIQSTPGKGTTVTLQFDREQS